MAERAELEENVARVLRGHPGGISLFRFRQAYGAAYSHPFPLDSTASVKEQLAAMPGVVRVEGWGVQTMLFPVCPQELPSEENGLAPSLPEAVAALASPDVVCPSPSISASSPEATLAPAGPEQPPVPCSPPPGHRVALGAPVEIPVGCARGWLRSRLGTMEPWLEVVVVAAGSPELGSDRDTLAGEGSSPARKRPRRSPPRTETPMEWEPLEPAGLAAIVPLVQGILSAFASGLRLAKLLELMRNQHGVDVEALCRAESAPDVLQLLAQVPGLRVRTPERGPQCLIQLERGVAAILAPFLGHVLRPFPLGLGLPKLLEAMRRDHDLDLAALSQEAGYKDVLELLGQVPGIWLHKSSRGRTYTVHLHAGVAATLAPSLWNVLRPFPLGLGLPKLLEAVWRDHDLDLAALSQEAGYKDVLELLGQVPGIWLHKPSRGRTYTVHLHAEAQSSGAGSEGPTPRASPPAGSSRLKHPQTLARVGHISSQAPEAKRGLVNCQ
ncbi:unnamed protein product [Caretta caretta]